MYSEYLKNGGTGIIQLLSNNQTLSYLLSDDIKTLDSAFLLENGEKKFSIPVENLLKNENDLTPIANMMKVRFGKTWKTLFNSIPQDNDPLANEVTKTTGSIDTNNQTTNQIAGYDSDTMVNDNSNQSTGSNKTTQTVTKMNYENLTNLLGELKNNVYYDILFSDIRNYIFVTVYGNERTL
jgi:hypothetical protein